jgi:hypothetical protein
MINCKGSLELITLVYINETSLRFSVSPSTSSIERAFPSHKQKTVSANSTLSKMGSIAGPPEWKGDINAWKGVIPAVVSLNT